MRVLFRSETIGFTAAQTERLFEAATCSGLPVKLRAEQLSNQHGAALAARFGALSADHLEYLDAAGIAAMARAGTVATLLPGAFYFMRETRLPPIDALRSEEHTSELQSLMRISYAVFCLKKKKDKYKYHTRKHRTNPQIE